MQKFSIFTQGDRFALLLDNECVKRAFEDNEWRHKPRHSVCEFFKECMMYGFALFLPLRGCSRLIWKGTWQAEAQPVMPQFDRSTSAEILRARVDSNQ